eukprot:scaffold165634_cov15-Tisochrysis_lutea.AAC.1
MEIIKHNRESSPFSKKFVLIACKGANWEPSWEPDTKERWPTLLQRIVGFETHKDEPKLSILAAGLELDNLERQELDKADRKKYMEKGWTQNTAT